MKFDNKKIIGLIAFVVGILLISFSSLIPLPNVIVFVVGALLIAFGVLSLIDLMDAFDKKQVLFIGLDAKHIIGFIAFLLGILIISYPFLIALPILAVNVVGGLLIAFGALSLIDLMRTLNKKQTIGLTAVIIGILLISFSYLIPISVLIVNVIGAVLLAFGALSLIHEYV
jgi:hypothetical protein